MGNAPSAVPYGAQSNAISAEFFCNYGQQADGFSNFYANISYTAPLAAGSGQKINITDINASLGLPARFYVSILDSGAAYYYANTTITFDTTNASPETLTINEYNTRRNVSYFSPDPRGDIQITVPAPGRTPTNTLSVGPITLGSPGQSDFRLRGFNFTINVFTAGGQPVAPLPYTFSCNPRPEPVLASIVVDNTPVQPLLALANNAPAAPKLAYGQKSTTASIPIKCTKNVERYDEFRFNYTFAATGPLFAQSGQAFNLSNVNNYVTVPGLIAGEITATVNGGLCGEFIRLVARNGGPGVGLSLSNASPKSIDVSNTFVASDPSTPNPLVTGRYVTCSDYANDLLFALPRLGSLSLTNIVPGAAGSSFAATIDSLQGDLAAASPYQGETGGSRWVCTPLRRSVLLSAPIT